jgi:hypothetical protein
MQRSPPLAARECGIGRAGALSRLVNLPDNDGVQGRVMPLRARQIEFEQFGAADAPVPNVLGQLGGGCECAISHALVPVESYAAA